MFVCTFVLDMHRRVGGVRLLLMKRLSGGLQSNTQRPSDVCFASTSKPFRPHSKQLRNFSGRVLDQTNFISTVLMFIDKVQLQLHNIQSRTFILITFHILTRNYGLLFEQFVCIQMR